jgi:hypothetical protein
VGSATLRRPDLPWFSNNFAIDIFMPVILAEKTANSFATITVFRDLPSFFTVFGNSCKKISTILLQGFHFDATGWGVYA